MKNNIFIIRLHMLILSPVFPSLLTFILLIVYKINFEPVILCDNGSSPMFLQQLKTNLVSEIERTTILNNNYMETYNKIQEINEKLGEPSVSQKAIKKTQLNVWGVMIIESINKTKEIEYSIRKIEPDFSTGMDNINARILWFIEQNT